MAEGVLGLVGGQIVVVERTRRAPARRLAASGGETEPDLAGDVGLGLGDERAERAQVSSHSKVLDTIYTMRDELAGVWQRSTASKEQLVHKLEDWCHRAETSGIAPLQEFSRRLRCYA